MNQTIPKSCGTAEKMAIFLQKCNFPRFAVAHCKSFSSLNAHKLLIFALRYPVRSFLLCLHTGKGLKFERV